MKGPWVAHTARGTESGPLSERDHQPTIAELLPHAPHGFANRTCVAAQHAAQRTAGSHAVSYCCLLLTP